MMIDRNNMSKVGLVLVIVLILAGLTGSVVLAQKGGKLERILYMLPRGKAMLDDGYFIAPQVMGYFAKEGLDPKMEGTVGATDCTKLVASKMAETGAPSPYVQIVSVLSGMPVKMCFQMDQINIFGFAVRPDSGIKSIAELKGKKIALGSGGWSVISDPILMNAGVDPKSVENIVAGEQRAQITWRGQADAVLTWEKEYQTWAGQGLTFDFLAGRDIVQYPGNGFVFHVDTIEKRPDVVVGFGRGVAKGLIFSRENPEAVAEMILEANPALKEVGFEQAVVIVKAMNFITRSEYSDAYGLGVHIPGLWEKLQDDMYKTGTIDKKVPVYDYFTNEFIRETNNFDKEKVIQDAIHYQFHDPSHIPLRYKEKYPQLYEELHQKAVEYKRTHPESIWNE